MKKLIIHGHRPINPSPAALITTADENGVPNVLTLGEVFNISINKPLIMGVAIRPATYSNSIIKKTGEFVINLTTTEMVEKVDRCGSITGRNNFNKFEQFNLTPIPSTYVKAPLIDECPVNIECKVISIQEIGDHDLFIGEVLAVHADSDKTDTNGDIDFEKLDLLVYLTGSYWSLGKKLGNLGYSHYKEK
jgi:flavin reductase (DIM6/NTAB) family NADH-FMN oxidoreductase RutF